jgi:hypothetical protein
LSVPLPGPGAEVRAFALPAEQAEELDWLAVGGAEPVRHAGIELGRFAGCEHHVLVTEDHPQPPVEDIEPFVALMGPRIGFVPVAAGRDDELVGLDAARSAGQRQHGHTVPGDGPKVDARISGGRRVDEFVERDAMGSRQRQQQFEGGPAGTGFQPGQGAHRDPGRGGQIGQRGFAPMAQLP